MAYLYFQANNPFVFQITKISSKDRFEHEKAYKCMTDAKHPLDYDAHLYAVALAAVRTAGDEQFEIINVEDGDFLVFGADHNDPVYRPQLGTKLVTREDNEKIIHKFFSTRHFLDNIPKEAVHPKRPQLERGSKLTRDVIHQIVQHISREEGVIPCTVHLSVDRYRIEFPKYTRDPKPSLAMLYDLRNVLDLCVSPHNVFKVDRKYVVVDEPVFHPDGRLVQGSFESFKEWLGKAEPVLGKLIQGETREDLKMYLETHFKK